MHKTKHKNKSAKIPKPITIKKEKTEEDRTLKPMSQYIDDRLELVKQIFGTLKPKTIVNLAPEFLKKKNLEEIEELCLHELLCISTKRLLSIINATKVPSDTESSEDSDVEHKEEHVSLEEISSDSELESSSTAKRKLSATATGSKKGTKKSAENDKNDGQISVLELLELQARARAIRSQLALEPVTKIEVDSDDTNSENISKSSKEAKKSNKRKSGENEKESSIRGSPTSTSTSTSTTRPNKENGGSQEKEGNNNEETEKRPIKKIKIKRNFRKAQQEKSDIENQILMERTENSTTSPNSSIIKNEKISRTPSLEVIPIVAEPETLMISDSSETEAESSKISSQQKLKLAEKTVTNPISTKETADQSTTVATENESPLKTTEPEEGEITETETETLTTEKTTENGGVESTIGESCNKENTNRHEIQEDAQRRKTEEITGDVGKTAELELGLKIIDDAKETKTLNTPTVQTDSNALKTQNVDKRLEEEEYDDQNDDVISIEGGDLETEMTEHLVEDTNTKTSYGATAMKPKQERDDDDDDIISLDSSEAEAEKDPSESWHSRYVKSSKVSKVLAEARLAKRVRDKIKKSKRSKKESTEVHVEKPSSTFSSKHEDGSVEQYKELLQMRQRKN